MVLLSVLLIGMASTTLLHKEILFLKDGLLIILWDTGHGGSTLPTIFLFLKIKIKELYIKELGIYVCVAMCTTLCAGAY